MTTDAEQNSAANLRGSPEPSKVADASSADKADHAAGSDAQAADAAPAPHATLPLPPKPVLALTDAQADRLAASFRPSWEPAQPMPQATAAAAPTPTPLAPHGSPITDTGSIRIAEAIGLPGAKQRRKGLLLAAAAVVGFGLLAVLGLLSSASNDEALPEAEGAAAKPSVAKPMVAPPDTAEQAPVIPAAAEREVVKAAVPPAPAVAPEPPPELAPQAKPAPLPEPKPIAPISAASTRKPRQVAAKRGRSASRARPTPKPSSRSSKGAAFVSDSPY